MVIREVEKVRHEYSTLVEELKARHQLRMAAIDRRLQAHQESFTLWRKLITSDKADGGAVIIECQTWWNENCLYLEPRVRQAFLEAYTNENMRREFVEIRADYKEICAAADKVSVFPKILFEAIQLPAMTDTESKLIQDASTVN